MRTGLSFSEILVAIIIAALLCVPQALAYLSHDNTGGEETYVMTADNSRVSFRSGYVKPATLQRAIFTTSHARPIVEIMI